MRVARTSTSRTHNFVTFFPKLIAKKILSGVNISQERDDFKDANVRLSVDYVPSEEHTILGDYYYEDLTGESSGMDVADAALTTLATEYPENGTTVSFFGPNDSSVKVTVHA